MIETCKNKHAFLIILLAFTIIASVHAYTQSTETTSSILTANDESEKLVILMPTPSKYLDPYIERFKEWYYEQTGKTIEVEHVRMGGVKCIEHIEEQEKTPEEDIVASIGYDEFERLKTGGFLEQYESPNRVYIPDEVGGLVGKDSEGYYTGFSLAAYGIMVNLEVLQDENLATPAGYRDLALNTDYYGFITMGSPASTSIAHGNAELILASYGWIQGWNISIHLASLVDRFYISTGIATSLVVEGEYAAVLTKNTYWNEYVVAGHPVGWVWPEEGTTAYILYNGVLNGVRNRENARLWIDWMLSEEGQLAWVESRFETVLRSDVELPAGIPTIEELDLAAKINPNYDSIVVEQQYDVLTRIWSEKLIGSNVLLQQNYLDTDVLNSYLDSWIIRPMQQAENALVQAQSTIDLCEMTTLTETGQVLLDQATLMFLEANTTFYVAFDHENANELATVSYGLAQVAMGYVPPPPVWPYYMGMVLAAIIAGSVSGKLGYDYFKRKYKDSMEEVFKQLKDKLEVDEAGRLLLVSDVMRVPMILTTRDYITQIQKASESISGKKRMEEVMYQSGFEGGHDLSIAIASMSDLKGEKILEEYLRIASVRGWGRFKIEKIDVDVGEFIIQIHSSIAEDYTLGEGKVCHSWRGMFAGVIQTVLESLGKTGTLKSKETKCMANGDPYCEIRVKVDYKKP